jgi:hypothetical protein
MTHVKRSAALVAGVALAVLPASAQAAAPRWLASVKTTMTASVKRSTACGPISAGYRITSRTRQPIPVRKQSPAPGSPESVYAMFSPATRVTTSAGEAVEHCDGGESCGGGTFDRRVHPYFTAETIRGARLRVEVGTDTPDAFFIPKHGCNSLIEDRDGLLPRRFRFRVVKRVPYRRFSRDRFRIRISAKSYPVSVTDTNGDRIRGTGSFVMTMSFRPYRG